MHDHIKYEPKPNRILNQNYENNLLDDDDEQKRGNEQEIEQVDKWTKKI